MKIKFALGLCAALGASFIGARAADNPAQAAARAALEEKLSQPDAWEPKPATFVTNTPSKAVVEPAGNSATNVTEAVPEKAEAPQTSAAVTTPVTAPVAEAPATAAPVAAAPAAEVPKAVAPAIAVPTAATPTVAAPAAAAPAVPFPILSALLLSLLLVSLVIMSLLLLKLRQVKLLLLKHPAVTARAAAAPAYATRAAVVPAVVGPSEIHSAAAAATLTPTLASDENKRAVQRRKRVPKLNGAES